jgi:hypothetical protein
VHADVIPITVLQRDKHRCHTALATYHFIFCFLQPGSHAGCSCVFLCSSVEIYSFKRTPMFAVCRLGMGAGVVIATTVL